MLSVCHSVIITDNDSSYSEEFIALAILRLVELEKAVVEGAGATGLAALLAGLLPELKGKKWVYVNNIWKRFMNTWYNGQFKKEACFFSK